MSTVLPSYKQLFGPELNYKDCVSSTTAMSGGKVVVGRLLQVRLECGAFGSDVIFIRTPEGKLVTVENDMLKKLPIDSFPDVASDSLEQEYTILGKYPETGFIINNSDTVTNAKGPNISITLVTK